MTNLLYECIIFQRQTCWSGTIKFQLSKILFVTLIVCLFLFLISCDTPPSYPAGFGKYKIAIDPGHGGENLGAKSVFGDLEKHFTLNVANMLHKRLLASGHFDVKMVRISDVDLKPSERAKIVEDSHADALVSLHFNSGPLQSQNGFSMIWSRTDKYEDNILLAAHMANSFISYGFKPDRRMGPRPEYAEPEKSSDWARKRDYMASAKSKGIYEDRTQYIGLLRRGKIPSVLVEGGYFSNYLDCALFHLKSRQMKLIYSIEKGLISFFHEKSLENQ